jgi:copper chaperone
MVSLTWLAGVVAYSILTPAGVKSYNVSLETQTAEIVTEDSLGYDTVLEKIKKTGKKVNSGEADGVEKEV